MPPALAIFVKTPGLSPVKTRLAAGIGQLQAEMFHRQSTAAVEAVSRAAGPALALYWAVAENHGLEHSLWSALPKLWQGQGDLGARLHRVYSHLQARHGSVLLIGADTPQLTSSLLQQALQALQRAPFVLGPSDDGGFWLFGGRLVVAASIWQSIRYSQPDTAIELQTALAGHGEIAQLPTLVDVDRIDDLARVREALTRLTEPLPEQQQLLDWLGALPDSNPMPREI